MHNAELDVHLSQGAEQEAGNHRNGSSPKTVLTPEGEMTLALPRDHQGRFDPTLAGERVMIDRILYAGRTLRAGGGSA